MHRLATRTHYTLSSNSTSRFHIKGPHTCKFSTGVACPHSYSIPKTWLCARTSLLDQFLIDSSNEIAGMDPGACNPPSPSVWWHWKWRFVLTFVWKKGGGGFSLLTARRSLFSRLPLNFDIFGGRLQCWNFLGLLLFWNFWVRLKFWNFWVRLKFWNFWVRLQFWNFRGRLPFWHFWGRLQFWNFWGCLLFSWLDIRLHIKFDRVSLSRSWEIQIRPVAMVVVWFFISDNNTTQGLC